MNIKEVLAEKLKNDAAFRKKLFRAPKETLNECGIDTESEEAQAIIAEISRVAVKTIGKQELDSKELAKVTGAGFGFCECYDDCDFMFEYQRWDVEGEDRCYACVYCDELLVWSLTD